MDTFITVLRLMHILLAIFWVGTTLFMTLFLEPAIQRAGEAGGQVMQRLITSTRFPLVIALSGWLTILIGLVMYWQLYGFSTTVMFGPKLALTLGAFAGLLSGIVGTTMQGRSVAQIKAILAQIAAQGSPPTSGQLAAMQKLQETVRMGGRITAFLMMLAVIGMVV